MNVTTPTVAVLFTLIAIALPAAAQFHAGDIGLLVHEERIKTGAFDPSSGELAPIRVFGGTFGDSGFPGFTSNPGFDAPSGTFVSGTRVGFDAVAGLRRFTGDGLEIADDAQLRVSFLTLSRTIGTEPIAGFDLAVQSNGGFHRHLNFTLEGVSTPSPAPGVYVVEFELYSTDAAVERSEPFFIAFDFEAGDAARQQAIDWIVANLLAPPCPGDLDGDGTIGGGDLAVLLAGWGGSSPDLDGDGVVGGSDLAVLLSSWGEPCDP
jgi:hypothetical protein